MFLVLFSLLLLQISAEEHVQLPLDPELNIFFHPDDLKLGRQMQIYFPTKDPSSSPHLLSREESDSIPFAASRFPHILKRFGIPSTSKHASAMKSTLRHCETMPLPGETKFCACSLDYMLDALLQYFGGYGSRFQLLTTKYLSQSTLPLLQNYTVALPPESVSLSASKLIACHPLPYPYLVLYCHGEGGEKKLYKVSLDGVEDGGRVEAIAICHMDTSRWDPEHVAFRVLRKVPGDGPVCHFFAEDNLVWIQKDDDK